MKKFFPLFFSLAIVTSVFAGGSNGQIITLHGASGQAVVQGFVYDSYNNLGLEGVTVGAIDFTTTTLDDGSFTLIVDEGNYDLYFIKEGWITHVIPALVMVDTLNIDVTLQRLPLGFPFTEDWSSGSFETNLWTFEPEQGNWQINDTIGNPEPSAIFIGDTVTTDYSFTLVSHVIDATSISESIILSFDLMMLAGNYTGDEKLKVAVWNEEEWIQVAEYQNDTSILWETQNIDITAWAAGKLTKLKFEAVGQNSSAIDAWGIDNIELRSTLPMISVSPSSLSLYAPHSNFYITEQITITNIGNTTLEYTIDMDFNYLETCWDNREFHHDGDWSNNSIGTGGSAEFMCAARFTLQDLTQFHFGVLGALKIHIAQPNFSNVTVKVWDGGSYGDPGTEIYSKDVTGEINIAGWTTIALDQPIPIDANKEYWLGYSIIATSGHPASVDPGPVAQGRGAWIYWENQWQELTDLAPTLDYNFCIRGVTVDHNWISIDKLSGILLPTETDSINLFIQNCGFFMLGEYLEYIHINSNDLLEPLVIVPVNMVVGYSGVMHQKTGKISVYPNPSNDFLTIESDNALHHIILHSVHGSLLMDVLPSGSNHTTIDTRHLEPGVYLLTLISNDGQPYHKKIVISR